MHWLAKQLFGFNSIQSKSPVPPLSPPPDRLVTGDKRNNCEQSERLGLFYCIIRKEGRTENLQMPVQTAAYTLAALNCHPPSSFSIIISSILTGLLSPLCPDRLEMKKTVKDLIRPLLSWNLTFPSYVLLRLGPIISAFWPPKRPVVFIFLWFLVKTTSSTEESVTLKSSNTDLYVYMDTSLHISTYYIYLRPRCGAQKWKLLATCTDKSSRFWVDALGEKYDCGVISDILRPCHRFLQMGFSPPNLLTFGERRWCVIPQTPPKRQSPSLFLFLDPFPSVLTGLHVCQHWKWVHASHKWSHQESI